MTCTDTAYIPDLSVNIFNVTHALTQGFNLMSDKESLVLKKNATIVKFEGRLDNGNSSGYLFAMRLYTSPSGATKTNKEGKKPEGETTANMEGTTRTTYTAKIKHKTRGEEEVEKKKIEPCKTLNHSKRKRIPYAEKNGEEYETSNKIAPIRQ